MHYKIIINKNQLSLKELNKLLQLISNIYIIITLYNNTQYYVIYLSLTNLSELSKLYKYECNITKSTHILYYIIYKVFLLIEKKKKYKLLGIFLDNSLYNISKIKCNHMLSLDNYLKLFKIENNLKSSIYNYLHYYNYKLLWIYHNNKYYLNFIHNLIYYYKKSKIKVIDLTSTIEENKEIYTNIIQKITLNLSSIFNGECNYKFIIITLYNKFLNISTNIFNDLINNLIKYSYNYTKEHNNKLLNKSNIIILSYDINSTLLSKFINYDKYIKFYTFNNINN